MAQRYDTYKDSGVQWLGEIPGHWKTVRVKALLSERVDKSDTGLEEPLSMSQKYGIIPTREMDVVPNMASTYIGAKRVFKQDLVFNKLKAHLGVFAISKYDGLVSPDYAVYTPNERTYLPFMEYVFHTPLYIGEFTRRATGVAIGLTRLYTNGLFAIPFLYPPIKEQHSIVSYLDVKCGKIDKMLEGKQKQIELLAEMKQRIIADAVTHGLNPDVKMKATNIPWLPEIPEHWDNIRLINCILLSVVGSWGIDEKKDGTDILCLRVADFDYNKGIINESKLTYRNYEGKLSVEKLFKEGDLLLEKSGGGDIFPVGRVVRYTLKDRIATCSNFIQKLTPNKEIVSSDFLYFWFRMIYSLKVNGMFFNQTTGIQNLKVNDYLKQIVYLPPLPEQQAIVSYITDKTAKIDALTSKLQQEIESIKEYKQRLISDVVAGQIKVC